MADWIQAVMMYYQLHQSNSSLELVKSLLKRTWTYIIEHNDCQAGSIRLQQPSSAHLLPAGWSWSLLRTSPSARFLRSLTAEGNGDEGDLDRSRLVESSACTVTHIPHARRSSPPGGCMEAAACLMLNWATGGRTQTRTALMFFSWMVPCLHEQQRSLYTWSWLLHCLILYLCWLVGIKVTAAERMLLKLPSLPENYTNTMCSNPKRSRKLTFFPANAKFWVGELLSC